MRFFPSIRTILTILLVTMLFPALAEAQAEPPAREGTVVDTGGNGVRCRAEKARDADVVTVLPEGASVELTGESEGGWQPVVCNETDGFVIEDFVKVAPGLGAGAGAASESRDPGSLDEGIILGVEWSQSGSISRELKALADDIGRMPPLVMWYQGWGDHENWSSVQTEMLDVMATHGAAPLITWEPWSPGEDAEQPRYRLDRIVDGEFDGYIDAWATELAAFGRPVYLRFAHEMNGDWYPWGAGVNGTTEADYVAAWRYVHDRFAAADADNVVWVWGPNADWYEGQRAMEKLYPGDEYVDWMALSGFNWGTGSYWAGCSCNSRWQSFEEIFATSYATLTDLSDKPIMVAETGSAEEGGDKAAWIADLETLLKRDYPRIRALVWFDEDREVSWRINSSPEAFAAFMDLAEHPYFQGELPS